MIFLLLLLTGARVGARASINRTIILFYLSIYLDSLNFLIVLRTFNLMIIRSLYCINF